MSLFVDEANRQVDLMQDDLANKAEVNARQQEEISTIMGKLLNTENKVKKVRTEFTCYTKSNLCI